MVLANGDLPGYAVRGTGAERLRDQLPPRGVRGSSLTARLVHVNWLASEHSILVARRGGRPPVWSDANLFARPAAARRILRLELQEPQPGARTRTLAPPAGAPAGAAYTRLRKGARTEYELVWPEGPVIGLLVVRLPAGGTAPAAPAIAATLARAARAQAVRIANVLSGQKGV
jgi:hypothetical protein